MQQSDDVEFEQEDESPADSLKKFREKLSKCVEEKQTYLDGWQRAKADFVNAKRDFEARLSSAREDGKDVLAGELGPVVDALDAALVSAGKGGTVAEGVKNIASQLFSVLKKAGIEAFGEAGDTVDPRLHEAIGTKPPPSQSDDHTVAKVHQRGLKRGDHIIRPATVTIYQSEQ